MPATALPATILDVLADPDVVEAVEALLEAERRRHAADAIRPDYAADPHGYPRAKQAKAEADMHASDGQRVAWDKLERVLKRAVTAAVKRAPRDG